MGTTKFESNDWHISQCLRLLRRLYLILTLIIAAEDSKITGPVSFKSYYAVATFSDPKSKFSFAEGAVVQVITKDPSGTR